MGELGGFLRQPRTPSNERDPRERVRDYREILLPVAPEHAELEGGRCMDCGVPFCHSACPLGNRIPDWNDLVYRRHWSDAYDALDTTNPFPELTGRICPAPCEPGCVLTINDDPVAIKRVELAVAERAFDEGWVHRSPPRERTGRRVAVVGSGPAGLAAAAILNRAGHSVTVFERDEEPGGLLRFGIPDFKLGKDVVDRRLALLEEEGVCFRCRMDVGRAPGTDELVATHDAVVVATGSRVPRELPLPGCDMGGVRYAMDYLYACNRAVRDLGDLDARPAPSLSARDRHVVVIGGGDTAMDCVGNAHREGARSVTLLDIYPHPSDVPPEAAPPWPEAPKRLATTYALDEGGQRLTGHGAQRLRARDGRVAAVEGSRVGPPPDFAPVAGSDFELPADLVLVAIGFAHPEHDGLVAGLELELDRRGNLATRDFATSRPGVFAAGDARVGQSLVVTAIAEGRDCAFAVDTYLSRALDGATGAVAAQTS